MYTILEYILVVLLSMVILLQFFRIIRVLFEPVWLRHRVFAFPESRSSRVFYYLCSILVLLMVILLKLEIIT